MCTMTVHDIRKLAIRVQLERAKGRSPKDKRRYHYTNLMLLQCYNRGKERFRHYLDSVVNNPEAIPYDPWAHVGKNH